MGDIHVLPRRRPLRPLPGTIEIRARARISDLRGGIDARTVAATLIAGLDGGGRRIVELELLRVSPVSDVETPPPPQERACALPSLAIAAWAVAALLAIAAITTWRIIG